MKLTSIDTGLFKLDGGAMFGVVPKKMWQKLNPPDENNMCTWAMRCLLIETDDRKILVDTGIGLKQDDRFRSHFEPHGAATLEGSLKKAGLALSDITDVFLTHLHFDHVGGAVSRNEKGELVPTFPKATYWSNQEHYDWAFDPNPREKASFLKENFVPLQKQGILKMIPTEEGIEWLPGMNVRFVNGHTQSMMVLKIEVGNQVVVFCADLMPSSFHVRLPFVMSYDVRPLVTLAEKEIFLNDAIDGEWILFLEHDPVSECMILSRDDRGREMIKKKGNLSELLSE